MNFYRQDQFPRPIHTYNKTMHLTLKYIVILCARINSSIDQTMYKAKINGTSSINNFVPIDL